MLTTNDDGLHVGERGDSFDVLAFVALIDSLGLSLLSPEGGQGRAFVGEECLRLVPEECGGSTCSVHRG